MCRHPQETGQKWTAFWLAWAKPFSVLYALPVQPELLLCEYLIGIVHPWLPQIEFGGTWMEQKFELQMEQVSDFYVLSVLLNQFLVSVGCKETGVLTFSFHIPSV